MVTLVLLRETVRVNESFKILSVLLSGILGVDPKIHAVRATIVVTSGLKELSEGLGFADGLVDEFIVKHTLVVTSHGDVAR